MTTHNYSEDILTYVSEFITPLFFIKGKRFCCTQCDKVNQIDYFPVYSDCNVVSHIIHMDEYELSAMLQMLYEERGNYVNERALCQSCGDAIIAERANDTEYGYFQAIIESYRETIAIQKKYREIAISAIADDLAYAIEQEGLQWFQEVAPEAFQKHLGIKNVRVSNDKSKRIRSYLNDASNLLYDYVKNRIDEVPFLIAVRMIADFEMQSSIDDLIALCSMIESETIECLEEHRLREDSFDRSRQRTVMLTTPNVVVYFPAKVDKNELIQWAQSQDVADLFKVEPEDVRSWAKETLESMLK